MNKKTLIISILLTAIVVGGVFAFLLLTNTKSEKNIKKTDITKVQDTKKVDDLTTTTTPVSDLESTSSITTQVFDNISVTLSTPVNGDVITADTVVVRTIINGATEGTCTVTFKKDGSPDVKETAPLIATATYYACQGFDIDKSKFSTTGEWKVKVSVKNDSAQGSSEERKVTIK